MPSEASNRPFPHGPCDMLDIKWIRDNPEALDAALALRGAEPVAQGLIALDDKRRQHVAKTQELQERRNAASKEIGKAVAAKDETTAERLKAEVAQLKTMLQDGEQTERRLTQALSDVARRHPEPAARRCAGRRGRERQCRGAPRRRPARFRFRAARSISTSARGSG